jgi:dipeptidyl aminopeptidase/acylaminoacyl peptidase
MTTSGKRPIAAEDLYRLELPPELRLSPDGRRVVFTVQRVDRKTEKKHANLWVVLADGSEVPRQFTFGDHGDTHPRWSPDGREIAFLSNRGNDEKPAQIYLIPSDGGEARPLTSLEGSIDDLAWSPDGQRIACRVRKTDAEVLEREKDEQKKKLGVVVRHYDRLFYKLDGSGYLPQERWHIWTVDARTGEAKQLTDHRIFDEQMPSWSPDGRWLAFTSNRWSDPDMRPDLVDLFVMPCDGGEPRKIETPVGEKSMPSFSPDGKWIAYYGTEGEGLGYRNQGVWVVPADGSASPRNLTADHDIHAALATINDVGQPEQMPPTWSLDGGTIYFPAALHGSSLLMAIGASGGEVRTALGAGGVVGSFSLDREQTRLAYFYGTTDDPAQVRVRDVVSGEDRQVTQLNRALLDEVDLSQVEEVWLKGPDGNDLQGWILKPPDFDPGKRYPSILEIHGGPLTQYGHFFMHEFYFLAAHGYVVHYCNPRGGRGYGEAHAKAIWGNWGRADYADLMAWTDHVARLPYVDSQRMGVTGGSYGGYMTVWIVGHTDRFKAAVTQRCVSNLVSLWGSSDFNWVFQEMLGGKAPYEDVLKLWDQSPMKYIGSAKTPTLVIHNEMDLRCPIEQGEQVFVALKRLGVETEMVRFPDEFHGLSRTGRTDRRIARLSHILRWFETRL